MKIPHCWGGMSKMISSTDVGKVGKMCKYKYLDFAHVKATIWNCTFLFGKGLNIKKQKQNVPTLLAYFVKAAYSEIFW